MGREGDVGIMAVGNTSCITGKCMTDAITLHISTECPESSSGGHDKCAWDKGEAISQGRTWHER